MNINHLVKKAVKENKVKELLQGEGEYYVGFDSFVGAVAPTDWTIIISVAVNLATFLLTTYNKQ